MAKSRRLGEVLLEMGLVRRDELLAMISLQRELRRAYRQLEATGKDERFALGRLFVESGILDEAKLEQALARTRLAGRRLWGMRIHKADPEVLQRFIERQRRLTLAAAVGVALMTGVQAPATAGDRAQVQIVATVLPRAYIERQRMPQQLVISEHDVARGYVDVQEPVQVNLRSNYPAGVVIGFTLNSPYLSGLNVQASEGGTPLAAAETVFVPQREPGLRARSVSLKLRLKLAPHAVPGAMSFPVTLSLDPA